MRDSEIEYLIRCEKKVIEPPHKNFHIVGANKRNDFKVSADNDDKLFSVFLRQNIEFQENFSIGLLYHFEGKKVLLFRVNGNHGEVVTNPLKPSPHFGYHVHKLTENEFDLGNYYDPKLHTETEAYASFDQAIVFFIRHVNIIDGLSHFPNLNQLPLFES